MVTGNLKDSKGNIRYFDEKTGLLTRGWRTDAKGYKYYYYSGSGVMATGWVQDKKSQRRYFSKANGRMLTGWVENSAGNYRYFHPTSGILYVGLQKVGEDYYYSPRLQVSVMRRALARSEVRNIILTKKQAK